MSLPKLADQFARHGDDDLGRLLAAMFHAAIALAHSQPRLVSKRENGDWPAARMMVDNASSDDASACEYDFRFGTTRHRERNDSARHDHHARARLAGSLTESHPVDSRQKVVNGEALAGDAARQPSGC